MNGREVVVTVHGVQIVDGEKDITEITVLGVLSGDEQVGYTLEYTEYGENGIENKTVVTIGSDGFVSVNRFGEFTSEMFFENKKRHSCRYDTPYGKLDMSIYTKSVASTVNCDGGIIEIEYDIDFNMGFVSRNIMTITVSQGKIKEKI